MRAPQPYSKKIYLASLALFWGGLCAGFLAVLLLSCRQSFAARTRALLDRQHTVAATLANDTAALLEEQRPQTVPALWRQTGRSLRDEGLALAVWQDGRCLYSDLALADLPEAAAPRAEARGVRPLCAEPGPLTPLWGDAALLESLLVNLCDNGAKACAPGGQVELAAAAAADGGCTLTVRDNGCGMDADTLARLGQPFFRADKARARADGGAGLGVTLCYRIAAAHGAELTYSSRPGAGTAAAVRFPPGGRKFTTLQQDGDPPVTPAP